MESRLIHRGLYEAENPIEVSLIEAFNLIEPQLRPPFPLKIPTQPEYLTLNRAILYGVLCESHLAKVHVKHLHGIVTDGYSLFTSILIEIVNGLYSKLVDSAKIQLIWVTSELVTVSADGIDGLLVALLRQMLGGNFSEANLWLCSELVTLFLAKWDRLLEDVPLVLSSALYAFLRLLADHCSKLMSPELKIEVLKRREIDFCIRVFREQFHLCLQVGRDLVRLLQDLVHVPEFRSIWKDLILTPVSFKNPGYFYISQLYQTRTSSNYFLLRITPEMESHLRFLLTNVKLGSQKRYQIWFARKFLSGLDSETVLIDIVRFICCAHHPPKEFVPSNVIPRWAVLGWLLKCCTRNYLEANVKLALFYDWLFYNEQVDDLMNIEPAILLIINSIPRYMDITHNLLEFLFILVENYDIDRKKIVVKGVSSAFDVLIKKGVVQSYNVLTSCDMLSPPLKQRLLELLSSKKVNDSTELRPAMLPCNTAKSFGAPLSVSDQLKFSGQHCTRVATSSKARKMQKV